MIIMIVIDKQTKLLLKIASIKKFTPKYES